MPNLQKGFVQIFLIFLLLLGLIAGLYLVQHPQLFKTKAYDQTRIETVDSSGNVISSTSSASIKVKLTYVAPSQTPVPTPLPPSKDGTYSRVFITSTDYDGDLQTAGTNTGIRTAVSGLDGGDLICQSRAEKANLGGAWRAWVSGITSDAKNRVIEWSNYKLLNGQSVTPSDKTLFSDANTLQNPIKITELLTTKYGDDVWTNTLVGGTKASTNSREDCYDWTSKDSSIMGWTGNSSSLTNGGWSNAGPTNQCNAKLPIYCFEINVNPSPAPVSSASPAPTISPTVVYRLVNDDMLALAYQPERAFDQNGKIVDWTLNSGAGTKIIYAQFKVNGTWGPILSTTINYTPPTASVTASPNDTQQGQFVNVSWQGNTNPTNRDWVGLYAVGATVRSDWYYVKNPEGVNSYNSSCNKSGGSVALTAGTCRFFLPQNLQPGKYVIKLFPNDTENMLAQSNEFNVTAANALPQVSVAESTIAAGNYITVTYNNIPSPLITDWLDVRNANNDNRVDWGYVKSSGTCTRSLGDGKASGTCKFLIPAGTPAGDYIVKLLANDILILLATSNKFHITQ